MTTPLGITVQLDTTFAQAVQRTREVLKAEGFGILTEVDLQATFREKLGREFPPYLILGACNPPLAFRALSAEPQVGLMLPCNVTVEARPAGGVVVRMVDPTILMSAGMLGASPALSEVASDARVRLERAARALGGRG
ncbi:MAG TPA: DUF302 domain-containing protein, partial [Gemmatimonadales bacterium]|nr:DUF302 domain-containing protein [Gemmatimonadales bacterium]